MMLSHHRRHVIVLEPPGWRRRAAAQLLDWIDHTCVSRELRADTERLNQNVAAVPVQRVREALRRVARVRLAYSSSLSEIGSDVVVASWRHVPLAFATRHLLSI